jgi:hypothetical protein
MFGHVGGGATVLTAQRQALQHAQRNQDDRSGHADAGVVGQHTDDEGRRPMIRMVTRKVYLRPIMSPSRPNTSAPNGRTMKPAAKASSAKMNCSPSGPGREELLGDDDRQ